MAEYIKREDVIALAWDVTYKNEWHMHEHDEVVSVSDIAEIPSADVVERKKGKWEDNTKDESWKCSECGFIFYSVGFYNIYNTKFRMRFCPNCGANMMEEI